ncbi:MAG: winged helix-turn-helix transcriptional regulator [Burkholderiales bacterium]|nr:winged helix-turn-helix transcriptional regulator [Burkholderiales bacterium]
MNAPPDPDNARTLEILDIVQRNEQVSQRHLARQLGVALGLANSYLKRCVKKGWVKVQQAPANRYLYYLTPTGFTEKSRLTAEYLSTSLGFYREAGDSCSRIFDQCEQNGWHRVLLCGVSEVAEIAILRSLEREIEIIGIFDPMSEREKYVGRVVWREFTQCPAHDVRILTSIVASAERYADLSSQSNAVPLLVPDVLRLEAARG